MMRLHLRQNPADHGETLGIGQTVGGRPIIERLTWDELLALRNLTRWAAEGCVHSNRSAKAAQLMRDADWLTHVISQRAQHMAGG